MSHSVGRVRRRVLRADGRTIHLSPKRGHLIVCARGCCCGRDDKGKPAVFIDFYKAEYKRRQIRDRVQLTMSGCIGPCPLLNVALVLFDGRRVWFQSINHESQILRDLRLHRPDDRRRPLPAADRRAGRPRLRLLRMARGGRPRRGSQPARPAASSSSRPRTLVDEILLLSHADTDLLTLRAGHRQPARRLPQGPDGEPEPGEVRGTPGGAWWTTAAGSPGSCWPGSTAGRKICRAGGSWRNMRGRPTSGSCWSTRSDRRSPSSSPARPSPSPCSNARPLISRPAGWRMSSNLVAIPFR